jgi:putative ABC transport system permease protein
MDTTKLEIVIGEKIAKILNLEIGDTIALNSKKRYKIVGIYSSWLNFLNSGVILNLKSAQTLMKKPNKVSLVFLTLKDTIKTDDTLIKINEKFPEIRAVESQQLPNYLGPIKSVLYFSKIVSVMTLFIAVAVLLNTFIMAISERTKEIGILSAIGWTRQMIITIFLTESLVLSFSGGIIGYLFSYPVMIFIQNIFTNMIMYLPSFAGIDIFFNVLLMCLLIGVLSVLFPAFYGTKIEIAKAMRHE